MATKLKAVPKDQAGGSGSRSPDDGDVELDCNVECHPLLPEGTYELGFVKADLNKHLWGRSKLFLQFQVLDVGEHHGKLLFMSMNFPKNGSISISSKFLQQWMVAAGGPPARRDRLSTRIFRGKVFAGRVRTVTSYVHSSGKLMDRDPSTYYSVVDHLIEVRAGR